MTNTNHYKFNLRYLAVISVVTLIGIILLPYIQPPGRADGLSGSDFKAGRIIDDVIFYNKDAMSTSQIQLFLNSKVPVCDTNHARSSSQNDSGAPYTCLKDYRQNTSNIAPDSGLCNGYTGTNNETAAQIIYKVAQSCGINPQVLLVMLQKEQGLITDTWPWDIQYRKAMGAFCPDTAPCDPNYSGFFYQVYYGAHRYKVYAANPNSFNYKAGRNNYILYNPNTSCGGSNVFIENQATASLYIYTPYQPNPATLSVGLGVVADSACGAYGNKNFWWYFNSWFGPTLNDAYAWEIVQNEDDGKIYLLSNRTLHWVPGPSIYYAWGLQNFSTRNVDTAFANTLPKGPNLSYVALDLDGTRYLMNDGKKNKLVSDDYVLAWGLAGVPHIWAPGVLLQSISGGNAGRFGKTTSGPTYLLGGTARHAGLGANSLSYWGQNSSNTTTVTQDILDRLPIGVSVDRYINASGKKQILDKGVVLQFRNAAAEDTWSSSNFVTVSPYSTGMLSKIQVGTFFRADNNTAWYYAEGGKKHYVSTAEHARIWGWNSTNPLITVSPDLLNTLTTSDNLGYLVQASNSGKKYLISGNKREIVNNDVLALWKGSQNIPIFSEVNLNQIANGPTLSSIVVGFSSFPHIYAIDGGKLRHIPDFTSLEGLGAYSNNPIATLSVDLQKLIPKGSAIGGRVKDASGNSYYLGNGQSYLINNTYSGTWKTTNAPIVSDSLLARLTSTGKTINLGVTVGGRMYIMNNGALLDVTNDYSNYGLTIGDFTAIPTTYLPISSSSSHLVGTHANNKIWLLASGRLYHIKNPETLRDLGYGVHSNINTLHANIISSLVEDSEPAIRVLRAASTGAIFASDGLGLGFGDLSTLSAYLGTRTPTVVSDSVFNKFQFSGWTTRIVFGTDGRVYLNEAGKKRWLTSQTIIDQNYSSINWTKLKQHTIDAFPVGLNL